MSTLYQRNFLRLLDFKDSEIQYLINLSSKLKKLKKNGKEIQHLRKKNIVLIFEKESTRTRCAFEVAAFDQGANVTYLGPGNSHLGYKESIADTAKVLSRMYHGIEYRGHNHNIINILAKCSTVPVWNGLTNQFHPTQILADLLTMQETLNEKNLRKISCAYVGDANNNISNTMLEAAAITGLNLRLVAPKKYWPDNQFFSQCQSISKEKKSTILCTENIEEGVKNVDFIYTDVWVSMGEPDKLWIDRIQLLKKYQVNENMIQLTKNKNVKILHCLPAFHDKNTILGKKILEKFNLYSGIEITHSIFEKNSSTIFEQSENRLHTIKAIMIATLIKNNCSF
ncbi:ornithine carbamoyltransferase [Buchnera aphidicola (Pemphigus obesinymphae)]|uniref:ornithine carbamoyltransferase n=1 Tax=Buchnera aphidicola TaxID=9 RepID=UPI002238A44A|nr:ornithine carbamoyltransferase [Buchnera aphidicola]MCW5196591.1 ornithine carbamoyltransferase [Buchnera aphidicola (Pemphigus obesinymphae)]